jgi:DNA-directed RNA polymerase specialized sigma subunit
MNREEVSKRRQENALLIKELSKDFTIKEIAAKLNVSVGTVNHIQNDPAYGIVNPRRLKTWSKKIERTVVPEGYFDYKRMGEMF